MSFIEFLEDFEQLSKTGTSKLRQDFNKTVAVGQFFLTRDAQNSQLEATLDVEEVPTSNFFMLRAGRVDSLSPFEFLIQDSEMSLDLDSHPVSSFLMLIGLHF